MLCGSIMLNIIMLCRICKALPGVAIPFIEWQVSDVLKRRKQSKTQVGGGGGGFSDAELSSYLWKLC